MNIAIKRLNQPEMQIDDEVKLIRKAQQDPAVFAPIYRKYLHQVYYYLLARVHHRNDTEDLTAQVFLEALEGLPGYREEGNFPAWLFTIARRRVADFHRRHKPEVELQEFEDILDTGQDLMTSTLHAEDLQSLKRQVANLNESERELLRLRFAGGLKFIDIANILNRNESTVKMTYYRLLSRMKSQLEVENDEL